MRAFVQWFNNQAAPTAFIFVETMIVVSVEPTSPSFLVTDGMGQAKVRIKVWH